MKNVFREYMASTEHTLKQLEFSVLEELTHILYQAIRDNKQIFTLGNGGSASTANHLVNDLLQIKKKIHSHSNVSSLACNQSIMTCIGNDLGYEYIFSEQLQGALKEDDLVIAYSVSGNSPNVLNTLPIIKESRAKLISFTGFSGGKLKEESDFNIHIESKLGNYGVPEAMHLYYGHLICDLLKVYIDTSKS